MAWISHASWKEVRLINFGFNETRFITELQQSLTLVTVCSVALLNSSIYASATVNRQINIFSYVLHVVLQLITTQATRVHISAHRISSSFETIIFIIFLYSKYLLSSYGLTTHANKASMLLYIIT
jgi:hypothetical protein